MWKPYLCSAEERAWNGIKGREEGRE